MSTFWKRVNFGWIWSWMTVYGGSLSALAMYLLTSLASAAAQVLSERA